MGPSLQLALQRVFARCSEARPVLQSATQRNPVYSVMWVGLLARRR